MDALTAMSAAITNSGMTNYAVSKVLGKSAAYVGATIARGSIPRVDTYATILNACGYDLLLRKRSDGAEIVIDPPSED